MYKTLSRSFVLVLVMVLMAGVFAPAALADSGQHVRGKIVVANRGSGDISILNARSGELISNVPLPQGGGENFPEPMYVVYTRAGDRFFVGDRANNRVVAFDADDFSVIGTAPAGAGVFHMWADPRGQQLWVNNDIDNTTTVIDPASLSVITTIPTPADLVALGGKPHDVILAPFGKLAYITVLGLAGPDDYVVQYRTDTFEEIGRAPVGKDPHLSLSVRNLNLYVPSQGGNAVYVLNRLTMAQETVISIPGAHGAGMTLNGRYFYTTNLPGGGADGLFVIDTKTNTLIGEPVDTPYAAPHNIALTPIPHRLYLTHSGGASDKVTFYDVSLRNPEPVFAGEVTVGLNPFGITYVP